MIRVDKPSFTIFEPVDSTDSTNIITKSADTKPNSNSDFKLRIFQ